MLFWYHYILRWCLNPGQLEGSGDFNVKLYETGEKNKNKLLSLMKQDDEQSISVLPVQQCTAIYVKLMLRYHSHMM